MNDTIITALQIDKQQWKTNHILHLLLSIVTAGFWIPIWILVAINNAFNISCADRKINKAQKGEAVNITKRCFRLW